MRYFLPNWTGQSSTDRDQDVGWNGNLTKLPGDNPVWGGSIPKATVANYQNNELFIQAAPVCKSAHSLLPIRNPLIAYDLLFGAD